MHQLQNTNPEGRYAYKIKSTNNEHYRVNPVFGLMEPGAAAQVEITRLVCFTCFFPYPLLIFFFVNLNPISLPFFKAGPAKNDDHLEVLFMTIDAECTDPKAPFAAGGSPEFKLDVPLVSE